MQGQHIACCRRKNCKRKRGRFFTIPLLQVYLEKAVSAVERLDGGDDGSGGLFAAAATAIALSGAADHFVLTAVFTIFHLYA